MWFNLLKLDLASISTQIQGDVEGRNINIDPEDKCRKKLINFQNRLYTFTKTDGVYVDKNNLSNVPENIACEFVEKIDKMFNSITSFSIPVKEIDEHSELSDGSRYSLMHYGGGKSDEYFSSIMIIALNAPKAGKPELYFSRIILPREHHLLMREVKQLWEGL